MIQRSRLTAANTTFTCPHLTLPPQGRALNDRWSAWDIEVHDVVW